MPFALVTLGLIMIVSGARNTYRELGVQVVGDLTGDGNFTYWLVAIGAVGSIGYVDELKPFSRIFLALIIVAMILRNGGFFEQLTSALEQGPVEAVPAKQASSASTTPAQSATQSAASGGGDTASDHFNETVDAVKTFLPFFL